MAFINGKEILFSSIISGKGSTLIEKEITANGEYLASADNADGYSSVIVNVPSSGGNIIEVSELPEVGEEGKIYKVSNFFAVSLYLNGQTIDDFYTLVGSSTPEYYTVTTKPTENIDEQGVYYVTDDNDILMYSSGEWYSFSYLLQMMYSLTFAFKGEINSTAQMTEDGYYAFTTAFYAEYVNGAWQEYIIPSGTATITENGTYDIGNYATAYVDIDTPSGTATITENGTHDVEWYQSAKVSVPTTYIVETIDDLPTDAPSYSMAIVLRGE